MTKAHDVVRCFWCDTRLATADALLDPATGKIKCRPCAEHDQAVALTQDPAGRAAAVRRGGIAAANRLRFADDDRLARSPSMEVLRAIEARDPDGKPTEPTAQDRQAFWLWVEQTYGLDALDVYLNTPWKGQW